MRHKPEQRSTILAAGLRRNLETTTRIVAGEHFDLGAEDANHTSTRMPTVTMRVYRTIVAFFTALAISPPALSGTDGTKVFAQNSASIVKVEHGWPRTDTQGSGVVVDDALVVTNCHVIRGAPRIYVVADKGKIEARLLHSDIDRDLCLLLAPQLGAPHIAAISRAIPPPGTRVFAIGAPLGLELTLSDGIVSSLRETKNGKIIQTTAAISPGSSGGGLFDETGALIGITTAQLRQGQNLNFAVPLDSLQRWLDAYRVARRGARLAVGASRYPPHSSVTGTIREGVGLAGNTHFAASAVRLTSNYVATVCSAIGVKPWPASKGKEYVLGNGKYFDEMQPDWLIYADLSKDICIGRSAASFEQAPTVSIAKSSAVSAGDAVFAFVDTMSSEKFSLGIVADTIPAESGYGHVIRIRSSPPLGIGSGVFTQEGKLVGIVLRHMESGLALLSPVESLLAALGDTGTVPNIRPSTNRRESKSGATRSSMETIREVQNGARATIPRGR